MVPHRYLVQGIPRYQAALMFQISRTLRIKTIHCAADIDIRFSLVRKLHRGHTLSELFPVKKASHRNTYRKSHLRLVLKNMSHIMCNVYNRKSCRSCSDFTFRRSYNVRRKRCKFDNNFYID